MSAELLKIIDPEFVIPSATAANLFEFWTRLNDIADDSEFLLGSATLQALYSFLSSPPNLGQVPDAEFWSVVSKIAQRATPNESDVKPLCKSHLRAGYRPQLGSSDNVELLIEDLEQSGPRRVALRSLAASWRSTGEGDCAACRGAKVSLALGDPSTSSPDAAYGSAWRDAFLESYPALPERIPSYSERMFPRLVFSESAWTRLGTLQGSPREITRSLIRHLGILNDHAYEIWTREVENSGRIAQMGALGAPCSPESTNTRANHAAIKAREFQFGDSSIRCEWHTKLHPAHNRVHFAVHGHQVLVGLIVNHLQT